MVLELTVGTNMIRATGHEMPSEKRLSQTTFTLHEPPVLTEAEPYENRLDEDETFRRMIADGVTVDPARSALSESVYLVTTDAAIAKKYDMHDEREFFGCDGG
jgi:hypothetical protein